MEQERFDSDVFFAGGADADRIPYIAALRKAGLRVALYGSYWDRFRETRGMSGGQLDPKELCRRLAASKVALCLVRRANRDGHSMRSFEVPAAGGCMLAEDTAEHREVFGGDGEAVTYFSTPREMLDRANWLVSHGAEREHLAQNAHNLVRNGRHTYADRLRTILLTIGLSGK
ncbi:MAG: glycosyltransferase [Acidobacteriota bacterium]|nr:glycosyltransferase [Acidobacteriota bacterium]